MRPRSITVPVVLILVGLLFLVNNLRPNFSPWALISEYWPFLFIGAGVIGLIEVLYYASRGSFAEGAIPPRPMGGGWIFWVVILALLAAASNRRPVFPFRSWQFDGATFLGTNYAYDLPPETSPQVASQGVTRLVLENIRGNLSLRGTDSGDVKVSGHQNIRAFSRENADRVGRQAAIHLEHEGDAIVVRQTDPGTSGSLRITEDLEIEFPRSLNVEARERVGDLSIDDINGSVDLTGGRGDVRLNHIAKTVKIEGRGGDIQLADIAGEVNVHGEYSGTIEFRAIRGPLHFESSRTEFRVEGVPGTITMDLGDLKLSNVSGPVRFQTGTRDIEATDVSDALDLTVERGDIRVTETKTPLPKIDLRSHNGDITLSLPDNSGFELKGTTSRGDVSNDFGAALQTQSEGRGATIQGQTGNGPRITLATDRGTVSVKKL